MSDAASSPAPSVAARPEVDLRARVSSTLMSQGPRPLCVPFSLSLAHDALVGLDPLTTEAAMAPEAIWWACRRQGQVSASGMGLGHAGDALRNSGQPPLSHWPWNSTLGYQTEEPPTAAGSPPWRQASALIFEPAHDGVEDRIEDTLAAGYPVVLVIEVTAEFQYPAADGSIDVPDIRSPQGDYHAVLVVGAATDPDKGRRLLIRNSWSQAWGAGGYAWLPLDYLVANAVQAAVVIPSTPQVPTISSAP